MAGKNLIEEVRSMTRSTIKEALKTIDELRPKLIVKKNLSDLVSGQRAGILGISPVERLSKILENIKVRLRGGTPGVPPISGEEPYEESSVASQGVGESETVSGVYESEKKRGKPGWIY